MYVIQVQINNITSTAVYSLPQCKTMSNYEPMSISFYCNIETAYRKSHIT